MDGRDEIDCASGKAAGTYESGRSVYDWMVVSTDVNHDEAAGKIDGTESDGRVGSGGYSSEDAEHVESGGGVKWRGGRTCRVWSGEWYGEGLL